MALGLARGRGARLRGRAARALPGEPGRVPRGGPAARAPAGRPHPARSRRGSRDHRADGRCGHRRRGAVPPPGRRPARRGLRGAHRPRGDRLSAGVGTDRRERPGGAAHVRRRRPDRAERRPSGAPCPGGGDQPQSRRWSSSSRCFNRVAQLYSPDWQRLGSGVGDGDRARPRHDRRGDHRGRCRPRPQPHAQAPRRPRPTSCGAAARPASSCPTRCVLGRVGPAAREPRRWRATSPRPSSARGMQPGELVGTETELIEREGVSRALLREAVRLLEHHQIARMRRGPGGGLFVVEPSATPVTEIAAIYLARRGMQLAELAELRTGVEVGDRRTWPPCASTTRARPGCTRRWSGRSMRPTPSGSRPCTTSTPLSRRRRRTGCSSSSHSC